MNAGPRDDHPGELLSAYLDGELGPQDGARVAAHVEACETCRERLSALRAIADAMARGGDVPPPPPGLAGRVAVAASRAGRRRRRRVPLALAAAASVALVALTAVLVRDELVTAPSLAPASAEAQRERDDRKEPAAAPTPPREEAAQRANETAAASEPVRAKGEDRLRESAADELAEPVGEAPAEQEKKARPAAPPTNDAAGTLTDEPGAALGRVRKSAAARDDGAAAATPRQDAYRADAEQALVASADERSATEDAVAAAPCARILTIEAVPAAVLDRGARTAARAALTEAVARFGGSTSDGPGDAVTVTIPLDRWDAFATWLAGEGGTPLAAPDAPSAAGACVRAVVALPSSDS